MSARALCLRPAGAEDVRAVVAHYRADSGLGIALAFADQLQRLLVGIAAGAEAGSPALGHVLDLPGLRHWRVPRFPQVVVGLVRPDEVDVLRVLHGRRDLPAGLAA